jgi:Ca-activated chloride channel family protein
MTWYRTISTAEVVFILLFAAFYAVYIYRMVMIHRVLKTRFRSVIFKFALRTLYFALFIVALLGPSFGDISKEVKSVGKDIIMCVDLSESMNAFDIQPSRLEKVKFEMKNIVNAFNSDRIGLIIFSSEAFVQSPLTYDQGALQMFIDVLNTSLVPNSGTDFGPPLNMAHEKLTGEETTVRQQKSKVIILISDGEDFGENSDEAVSKIVEAGITLFSLGVGTREGSNIRTAYGIKTDRNGKQVVTKLDSRVLRSIAVDTGGKYFEINDNKNDIERLINTISDIEGELRDSRKIDVSANKYYYVLALGMVLLLADILIRTKTILI